MLKKIIIVFIVSIAVLVGQEHAGFAGNYFQNGVDARSIAMGNALAAGNDSQFPAFFNPAGISALSDRKVLFSHQFLSLDRYQSVISFTAPLPPVAGISIGWIGAGVKNIDGRDLVGIQTDYLSATENAFLITFGISPLKHLHVGGTLKILQNQLPNNDGNVIGKGVGFDFGLLYNFNANGNLALVVKNINSAYQWSNKLTDDLGRVYKDKFPVQIITGLQYKINSVIIVGEVVSFIAEEDLLGVDFKMGAEYYYDDYFIRAGYRNNRFALGGGLKFKKFDKFISLIDYALVIEPVASLTHVISYAINF